MQARLSGLEIDVGPFTSLSATKVTNIFRIGVGAHIIRSEGIVEVVRLNDDFLVVVSIVSSDIEKACSEVEAAGSNINTTLTGKMNELLTQNPPCGLYAIKKTIRAHGETNVKCTRTLRCSTEDWEVCEGVE